jgi:hypothetical protein
LLNTDGKVVVVGGMGLDTNPKDFFMSFDVHTNKWQALAPMPTARYATFVFLVGSKLYVVGQSIGSLFVQVMCCAVRVCKVIANCGY